MAARAVVHTLQAGSIATAAIVTVLEAATCLPSIAEAASQVAAPLDPVSTVRVRGLDHRGAGLALSGLDDMLVAWLGHWRSDRDDQDPCLPPSDASGSVHPAIDAVRKLLTPFEQAPLPRIYVVDPVALKVKTQANTAAFRLWRGGAADPNVFVNARADLWQRASRGERVATIALSAAIAHEIVHGRTKNEGPATQGEIEILQYFVGHDASLTNEERAMLYHAIEAAKRYGGHK